MTTLQLVDALRGTVEAINGGQFTEPIAPLLDLAASHIEDLAAAVDDMAATLEKAPVMVWEGAAYRCVPSQDWDAWVETWAVPCAVCGERRCLHDPSEVGPEVVASEPCVKCNGTGLRGYSSCSRCEGRGVQ